MSFSNIKDVLSRDEMKKIMAGSGGSGSGSQVYCWYTIAGPYDTGGYCADNNVSTCTVYCHNAGYQNCHCEAGY